MPPVRRKPMTIAICLCIVQHIGTTRSSNIPESYSIIGDGWTPIIGQHREPTVNGEITLYRNPASKNSETIQAEKAQLIGPGPHQKNTEQHLQQHPQQHPQQHQQQHTQQHPQQHTQQQQTVQPPPTTINQKPTGTGGGHSVNTISNGHKLNIGGKLPPHSKPMILLPASHSHGPHIPLGPMMHRPLKHGPPPPKHHHMGHPLGHGKRHHKPPPRHQLGSHSTRDDVYVPAPPPLGAYSYYTAPGQPQPHKTRINQPHGHIEYTQHYSLPSINSDPQLYSLSRAPVQQYIVPKHPVLNDVHYTFQQQQPKEDFTRNLVPPPFKYAQDVQAEKQKNIKPLYTKHAIESTPVTEQYIFQEKPKSKGKLETVLPPQFIGTYSNGNQEKAVEVQVTKEQLNVFHNSVPSNYNQHPEYEFVTYQTIKHPSEPTKHATYEVTEGKQWQETQPYYHPFTTRAPHKSRRPQHTPTIGNLSPSIGNFIEEKPFLPTPFKPDNLTPTIATQSEVSTIYTQLSNRNKLREHSNPNPNFFSVKEVSTHYPIVGRPEDIRTNYYTTPPTTEAFVELTTIRPKEYDYAMNVEEETTLPPTTRQPTTTYYPSRGTIPPTSQQPRKRPNQRRRRPSNRIRPTTTEEPETITNIYEAQKTQENETVDESTERPRIRRPSRYRITESPLIEREEEKMTQIRSRNRQRVTRPTTTEAAVTQYTYEAPVNHKTIIEEEIHTSQEIQEQEHFVSKSVTGKDFPESFEDQFKFKTEGYESTYEEPKVTNKPIYEHAEHEEEYRQNIFFPKPTDLSDVTIYETSKPSNEENKATEPSFEIRKPDVEEYDLHLYKEEKEPAPHNIMKVEDYQGTEKVVTISPHIPENEIDYTTPQSIQEEMTTLREIYREDYRLPTTVPTTTSTTTEATTTAATRPSRIRGRPAGGGKYDSNRPRFSVKDYRQRGSYTSTTSTESSRIANADASTRVRFPNRSRRPLTTSTTTTTTIRNEIADETTTEPAVSRSKFTPKDSRYNSENESVVEKHFRGNTRRPFGRYRSTTESSSTVKVSIKPNIFSNLKRPTPISLRNRIMNRQKNVTSSTSTTTTEGSTDSDEINETELSEIVESTLPYHTGDSTTEFGAKKTVDIEVSTGKETEGADILKNEAFMYSQRVSDLTSSAKNEYNTPGRFKNVPSSSRRVPNYFTLATDDPILPIQAFFPNIKDKSR